MEERQIYRDTVTGNKIVGLEYGIQGAEDIESAAHVQVQR